MPPAAKSAGNRAALQSVDRLLLRVDNIAAAARFYTETLGLRLDRQIGHAAALRFCDGDTELVLHNDRQRPELEVVLRVTDVRAMYADRDRLGLTFLSTPQPSGRGQRATIRDPFGHVLAIADRGDGKGGMPTGGDATPADRLFDDDDPPATAVHDRAALIEVYVKIGRTADDLPYTPHFERLYAMYARPLPAPKPDHSAVWREILTLRKSGKLPKLGPAVSKPPVLETADKNRLRALLGQDLGKRDRLPYTERFDAVVLEFNKGFARAFSPHIVWRLVATLAK